MMTEQEIEIEIEKEIKDCLLKKDMVKIVQYINEGTPMSDFYIPNKTDLLLELIVNKKIVLFYNILEKGFNLKTGNFLYLHHAVRTLEWRYVKAILDHSGSDIVYLNKKDSSTGNNALHIATERIVDSSIILSLSKAGLNWNTPNNIGQTPLHYLLRNYLLIDPEIIDEMVEKKVDINIQDKMNISPLDIINSFSYNEEWKNNVETEYLLQKLNIGK